MSNYSPIGGHSVIRTELNYKSANKAQTAHKIDSKTQNNTEVSPWNDQYYKITGGLKKVQVGKDQEKAQSEKDSHSKNRGGKKPN